MYRSYTYIHIYIYNRVRNYGLYNYNYMIAYEILEEALVGPRCGKIVQGGGASLRFAAPFRGLVRRKDSDLSGRPAGRCGGQPTRIRPPTRICICWDSTGGDTVSAGCVARSSRLGQGKDTDTTRRPAMSCRRAAPGALPTPVPGAAAAVRTFPGFSPSLS